MPPAQGRAHLLVDSACGDCFWISGIRVPHDSTFLSHSLPDMLLLEDFGSVHSECISCRCFSRNPRFAASTWCAHVTSLAPPAMVTTDLKERPISYQRWVTSDYGCFCVQAKDREPSYFQEQKPSEAGFVMHSHRRKSMYSIMVHARSNLRSLPTISTQTQIQSFRFWYASERMALLGHGHNDVLHAQPKKSCRTGTTNARSLSWLLVKFGSIHWPGNDDSWYS